MLIRAQDERFVACAAADLSPLGGLRASIKTEHLDHHRCFRAGALGRRRGGGGGISMRSSRCSHRPQAKRSARPCADRVHMCLAGIADVDIAIHTYPPPTDDMRNMEKWVTSLGYHIARLVAVHQTVPLHAWHPPAPPLRPEAESTPGAHRYVRPRRGLGRPLCPGRPRGFGCAGPSSRRCPPPPTPVFRPRPPETPHPHPPPSFQAAPPRNRPPPPTPNRLRRRRSGPCPRAARP